MKRWERWSFGGLAFIIALSGLAYFWMKYFAVSDDPFAVVNHPLQPAMLSIHVVASPALMLMFGIIFNSHIMRKLGAARLPNRKTGLASLATFCAMAFSGYLLQVTTHDTWLRVWLIVHLTTGLVFIGAYTAHLVISYRLSRQYAAPRAVVEAT